MSMFNSKEYAYSDVTVTMLGRPMIGIRGVKYSIKQDKEIIHAAGSNPHSIGRGKKTYDGSLTLLQSELEALLRAAGVGKSILDLRDVTIVVAYAPTDGAPLVTDTLKGVEFTEMPKQLKVNDMFQEVEVPFFCLDIQYGS